MSTQTAEKTDLIQLTIDGKEVKVPKGTTVYTAAKQAGIDIPIFCYMDRMPPFGACRMCLVEVEKMPKLQASCTLEATEGMVVKTKSSPAVKGREEIIEFLLLNHPLDCPICDKGGECPLQEQALSHGPGESRFYEEKRHFKKPYALGSVLMLDRERCIICARCTRFGDLIAGDHALEFIERGYKTEVGTPNGTPEESKFIGNTIAICPVGALTSNVYRFRARPWDNEPTNSTCTLCPVGCSMIFDSRDGEVMRTRAQENKNVNDMWLCDKGWFGYEFIDSPDRLQNPLIKRSGKFESVTWDEATSLIAEKLQASKSSGKVAGFGGNSLTVEENYLFQKLMRAAVGVNHVDHRIGMPIFGLDEEGIMPGMEISIGDCEELSYVVLLGLDLTEEFPVIWLRLKQAINRGAKVIFIGHYAPEIAPHLSQTLVHPPGKELEILKQYHSQIAENVKQGKKSALFVGRQYLESSQRKAILSELLQLQKSSTNLSLNIMEGRGNSVGARFAGMRPDVGPFNKPTRSPGFNALQVLENACKGGWDFLYVAGANPAAQFPEKLWKEARAKIGFLVVQDLFLTKTASEADVVLPTFSYVEKGGSFINIEGRVQTLLPGKVLPDGLKGDDEIFIRVAQKLNFNLTLDSEFTNALTTTKISLARPEKIELSKQNAAASQQGLRATFAHALFDHGVRMMRNTRLVQKAKAPKLRIHPTEAAKRNIQDGNVVQLKANGNAIKAKVKFDERVAEGTVVVPLGFDEVPVHNLGINLLNGINVEVSP